MVAFGGLQKVADAGINGFALQNGTPNILTWTAPNDGVPHRVTVFGGVRCSNAETGGVIQINATDLAGGGIARQLDAGGHGVGSFVFTASLILVQPGTTVTVQQSSALTVGAATAFAEMWGS